MFQPLKGAEEAVSELVGGAWYGTGGVVGVIACRCVLVLFFFEGLVHRHFILEGRQRVRLVAPSGLSALVLLISLAVLVFAVGMVGIRIVLCAPE